MTADPSLRKTCPCGDQFAPGPNDYPSRWSRRRYCSKACSGRYGTGVAPKRTHCLGKDKTTGEPLRHELVGDNLLFDRQGGRRCKTCAHRGAQPGGRPTRRLRRAAKPKPPAPRPVVAQQAGPVWRPSGWAPLPAATPRGA